jgi:DNA-directed RNA polymerase specialized sigma24 family protein
MPLGTVMWRLNMAKRLLRKQLQSTEDAESA